MPFSVVKTGFFHVSATNKNVDLSQLGLGNVFSDANQPNMRKRDLHRAYIFDARGDVSKRWFVYFVTISPVTGKRVRRRNYAFINQEPDPVKRTRLLLNLQQETQALLNSGIYEVKQNLYPTYFSSYHIGELLRKVISDKKAYQTKYSARSTSSHLNGFLDFLASRGMANFAPQLIKQNHIIEFRNKMLADGKSNRTFNNYLIDISAFFTYLVTKIPDYTHKNPCIGIAPLPTKSETHVVYTNEQVRVMRDWMKVNDPYLYLFCKFIAYSFLRVSEILNLKVGAIDPENWSLTRAAQNHKTGKRAYQHVQEIFRQDLRNLELHKYDPNMYLFSRNVKTSGRQNELYPTFHLLNEKYFTMRFRKFKDLHGYGAQHTMYGLKHTFISQLKRNGAKDDELLEITGLETREALYKYLKKIGALVPKDLSYLYTDTF